VRWFGVWIFLFAGLVANSGAAERKLKVLTTFPPIFSFTVNVTGDLAEVENLLSGGTSLHDYQLSPGDVKKITEADLIIGNGLGVESFLQKIDIPGEKFVRISDGLREQLIQDHGAPNPHIWLDPILVCHGLTNILNALQRIDPVHATAYTANAARYISAVRQLDSEIGHKTFPLKNIAFLTYHNAFPYFTHRYGLKLAGVIELVPEVPPNPRQLSQIHRLIREQKAKALFTSPESPMRLARQVVQDSGLKLGELDPLETGKLSPAAYEDGMRKNVQRLVAALQ
jgi:zinc transport system substrate-binding protein